MSHNMLLLLSGQMRENRVAMHSIIKFIVDLKTRLNVNLFVVLNTWQKSYSIFPTGVRSFMTDTDELVSSAHDQLMQLKMDGIITDFDIRSTLDKEANGHIGYLDTFEQFNKVAYLLDNGYNTIVELEHKHNIQFDSIIKTRPDIMIRLDHVFLDAFKEGKLVKPFEVKIPGGVTPFTTMETSLRSYTDFIEIFGRNAFRAYCSALTHLEHEAKLDRVSLRGSLHLWMYKHLMDYGINILPQDVIYTKQAIIRPTQVFLTANPIDFSATCDYTFSRLAALESEWSAAGKDPTAKETYLKLFNTMDINHELD